MTTHEKIEDLEARIAFQEDLLNSLNETVAMQDRSLNTLQKHIAFLSKKLDDMTFEFEKLTHAKHEPPPPHY